MFLLNWCSNTYCVCLPFIQRMEDFLYKTRHWLAWKFFQESIFLNIWNTPQSPLVTTNSKQILPCCTLAFINCLKAFEVNLPTVRIVGVGNYLLEIGKLRFKLIYREANFTVNGLTNYYFTFNLSSWGVYQHHSNAHHVQCSSTEIGISLFITGQVYGLACFVRPLSFNNSFYFNS
jgi:hypothetical protein